MFDIIPSGVGDVDQLSSYLGCKVRDFFWEITGPWADGKVVFLVCVCLVKHGACQKLKENPLFIRLYIP